MSLAAGVIAAGHGERLRSQGVIKPLVSVLGAPLSAWVLRSLAQAGVRDVTLLHNSKGRELRTRLSGASVNIALDFLEADTASSWESFRLVARHLARTHAGFLMSTIDAIIPPAEVARFSALVEKTKPLAGLALTSFVDDEKPLWAALEKGLVTKLGPSVADKRLVTAGLYYVSREAAAKMPEAGTHSKLRDFLISLVESGAPVAGCELSKTVDVDRPEDVLEAETYLRSVTW